MQNKIFKVLFTALLAISFVTRAEANPWWWPVGTPAKTVQIALPSNNGAVASVTVPSKTASVKPTKRSTGHRRAEDATINERDDERIAADLARHF